MSHLTSEQRQEIYEEIYAILAKTGMSCRDIYNELVLPFPTYYSTDIYKPIRPLLDELYDKPLIEVLQSRSSGSSE